MPVLKTVLEPARDRVFAEEFRACPVGHHSPGLQRLLNLFRSGALAGHYVLVTLQPYRRWQLARLSGVRGVAHELVDGAVYDVLLAAEWDVFRRRWLDATGEDLG